MAEFLKPKEIDPEELDWHWQDINYQNITEFPKLTYSRDMYLVMNMAYVDKMYILLKHAMFYLMFIVIILTWMFHIVLCFAVTSGN
jgi:hypothetical protein